MLVVLYHAFLEYPTSKLHSASHDNFKIPVPFHKRAVYRPQMHVLRVDLVLYGLLGRMVDDNVREYRKAHDFDF